MPRVRELYLIRVEICLHVVVQTEFVRVRTQTHRVDFVLSLVRDPRIDHVLSKHVAPQQEFVIGFKSLAADEAESRRQILIYMLNPGAKFFGAAL